MAEDTTTPTPAPTASRPARSGGRRDNRREQGPQEPKQFEELVINIDRVSRVVKGGRRFRFKALVVVGDRKTKVGIGVSKGADVQAAIAKATDVAKKHMVTIAMSGDTIPHDAEVRFSGAQVMIKPAAPGTGIIAGGVVRSIIGVTGIRNLLTKSLGSTNKVNIAYATIEALKSVIPKDEWLNAPKKSAAKTVETKEAAKPVAKPATKKAAKPAAKKEAK
ncbi:MAG TPA: 30S ribosomal protein S5 [Candidatus Saccharibacteria bacterium]|nr:30S ribosomal protein S5 [Candidatus Saccharibacteria bacterium]HRQ06692.1 30S ribosomal protein S5 [Candidatus Saccharibacteria bacterium]